eukprot:scaffold212203_cov33-Tisochrysis_lutea.AAC.6
MSRTCGLARSTASFTSWSGVPSSSQTSVMFPALLAAPSPAERTRSVTTFCWTAAGTSGLSKKVCSRKRTRFEFHRTKSYSASCGQPKGIGMSLGPMGKRQRDRKFQYRSQKQCSLGIIITPSAAIDRASKSRTAARCGASMCMCRCGDHSGKRSATRKTSSVPYSGDVRRTNTPSVK